MEDQSRKSDIQITEVLERDNRNIGEEINSIILQENSLLLKDMSVQISKYSLSSHLKPHPSKISDHRGLRRE